MEKVIFFGGSSIFAVPALRELAEHFDIALVVTNPGKSAGRKHLPKQSMIEDRAKKMGLPIMNAEKITDEIIYKIKKIQPDFFVIVDYGKIIPQKLLDIPPRGAINVHPSALPKYRGASPLQSAILNGEKETAFSIMLIDAQVDHGPILAQKKAEILPDDTYGALYKRLSDIYPKFLVETLKKYLSGEIKPVPQNDNEATFTKMLSREDGKINWSKSTEKIERMVRAYDPWPGTYTEFKNKKLKILACYPACPAELQRSGERSEGSRAPGELVILDKRLAVQCGTGILILDQVQPEGKRPMSSEEFVRGYMKNF